jgi:endonuclease YncB( thermonuclease family)
MKHLVLAGLLVLACTSARSETVEGDLIRVIDGDTVELAGERIRLIEPDAPEISKPRCNTELAKGLLASGRLRQLLKGPVRIARGARRQRRRHPDPGRIHHSLQAGLRSLRAARRALVPRVGQGAQAVAVEKRSS